jgi:flavin-dependent dehydrogenase
MRKKIVVGAGIAGMVAAIRLARMGHQVEVLERRDSIGGPARDTVMGEKTYVMADGTPMDLQGLARYTGIDITPACVPLDTLRAYVFGKRYDQTFPPNVRMYLVERGSRQDSLDMFLYRQALAEGVEFTFNAPVKTVEDFDRLPPGTILATGLFPDTFQALGIPRTPVYGWFANRLVEEGSVPPALIYIDRHTWDYAFFSSAHGIAGALLFQRGRPLTPQAKEWFPRRLAEDEGIEFEEWLPLDIGVLPTASLRNPRLFHRRFILAGTLAGMQDPVLLFGVHGALVSGVIAARALHDREGALREFRRMNLLWPLSYANRRFIELTFPWGLRALTRLNFQLYPYYSRYLARYILAFIPGWLRV